MAVRDLVLPWPWKLHEGNQYPQKEFWINDANGDEIVRFTGKNASAKAEAIMELGAQMAIKKRTK